MEALAEAIIFLFSSLRTLWGLLENNKKTMQGNPMLPLNLVPNALQRPRKCLRRGLGWALGLEAGPLCMVLPPNKILLKSLGEYFAVSHYWSHSDVILILS